MELGDESINVMILRLLYVIALPIFFEFVVPLFGAQLGFGSHKIPHFSWNGRQYSINRPTPGTHDLIVLIAVFHI
ncbi:hypothetical protein PmNV_026 [Penaeus monodon nudivirus]|uniref:Uncharacterized protein n=1 Tax=Penaeus monodon nudivirus TaxID=1529056 RepID=A0A076FEK7_9VIRU|nr:hypothetical protein PmNV_026 [Penaeus monodon nudivirus]AII15814.1 hypothetical protein PmNV_026 [Penaeus monodon nudivirus]